MKISPLPSLIKIAQLLVVSNENYGHLHVQYLTIIYFCET